MSVKIILTKDVENLGVVGDTVQVKPGYARNYLIPQGMALPVSSRQSSELEHRLVHLEKIRKGAIGEAQEQADKIKSCELEIKKKAGPSGKLFGSVTTGDIITLLGQKGFDLLKRDVTLLKPIKSLGSHIVDVKLHTEVKTTVELKVVSDGEIIQPEVKKETVEVEETEGPEETSEESVETV